MNIKAVENIYNEYCYTQIGKTFQEKFPAINNENVS